MDRDMSSTNPIRAKVEDREPQKKPEKQPWHEFYENFDSFKKAVDRAIERDPYGTLFGRRLRSPDTSNNSSWTSWSWIFDPKEIKQDPVPEPSKEQKRSTPPINKQSPTPQAQPTRPAPDQGVAQASVSHMSSSSKTSTTMKSSQSIVFQDRTSTTTEYIYDPISGRKVAQTPKASVTAISPLIKESRALEAKKEAPKKGLIETLFTEHGTPVAVKVYKPPKVYGYSDETAPKPKSVASSTPPKENLDKSFGSSKKREFNELRWRTIGNNIDSTNFNCEPWNKEPEASAPVAEQLAEERTRTSPTQSEDTPLFSGTTYESKSEQLVASHDATQKEGFRAKQGMTIPSLKSHQSREPRPSESTSRIEPAVDRTSSSGIDIPVKKFVSKLPTAIDRAVGSSRLEPATDRIIRPAPKSEPAKHVAKATATPRIDDKADEQQDKREDVDLLRASDVRANTKSTRVTKQATEDKKQQERTVLEQQFEQNANSDKANLDSVWKHIKQYPGGIVAKTMQSLGVANPQDATRPASTPAPRFSEPTTRPGIVRNPVLDNHTQVFEPQIANIVDQAKSVKRNLHDVASTIGSLINERAITAMANRDIYAEKVDPQPVLIKEPRVSSSPIQDAVRAQVVENFVTEKRSSDPFASNPPFIVLYSFPITGQVRSLPMHKLLPQFRSSQLDLSPMAALGSLTNPSSFVKHFTKLDQMGYELTNGSKEFLVFRKKESTPVEQQQSTAPVPSSSSLRASIAAEEAASQPAIQSTSKSKVEPVKAAEVLDQIPTTIPAPGPAAPTAPTSPLGRQSIRPTQKPTKSPVTSPPQSAQPTPVEPTPSPSQSEPQDQKAKPRRSKSRISRQEEVFSGLQRLKPQTTALPDPEHFQKQTPFSQQSSQQYQEYESTPRLGFFARVRRAIRRTVLTAIAFGAGAYGIGVVAEGLQAKAQITHGEEGGPMKRVVFEGDAKRIGDRQRVGIFSTESSR